MKEWNADFVDVGEALSLPADIFKTLFEPCPFVLNRRVFETHRLVLIPATFEGERMCFSTLLKLASRIESFFMDFSISSEPSRFPSLKEEEADNAFKASLLDADATMKDSFLSILHIGC